MVRNLLCGGRYSLHLLVKIEHQSIVMRFLPLEGDILIIDKPYGWSSFHVVKKVRSLLSSRLRALGIRKLKVGHAGTLDPLATGVMIVCTGKATKRIDELQAGVKTYVAEIALGATTPSFDLETPVDAIYPTDHIDRTSVEEVINRFRGTIQQVPPVYSAVKVDGHRAYKKARNGEEVELKAKTLQIDALDLLDYSPTVIKIRVVCSKGTYIRALARDIGFALNSGAHLISLRREAVGDSTLEKSMTVSEVDNLLSKAPMFINDEDGALIEVPPMNFDVSLKRKEEADIKPWHERMS